MTSKAQTERLVRPLSRKSTTLGLFLLKMKIKQKRKSDSFLFSGENNSKTFKKLLDHPTRESAFKVITEWCARL